MKPLDWVVIAIYMVGMLAVGEYYARRNRNTEDYLLGGRRMSSLAVGLSLFASLMSTNTYLSMPGEMIQHGPVAFAKVLMYPVAFLIGAYALIPFLMRLDVTSAYQILEKRFGLSIRLLCSTIFLVSRLLWMGLILYGLVGKVLLPIMGLPDWITPYACGLMGLITVIYTSVGGLRAVVATDVIQSFILFGGAILVILVITVSLGGVSNSWPTTWPEHWDTFEIGLNREARFTLVTACLSQLVWWICTSGSDQMAIQRYLATKNLYTARQVLGVSLIASFFTLILLALVGLCLLSYFQAHPDLAGELSVSDNSAATLFPHFIVIGLPQGITGLVIAGILAAAMSSLSSGFNSGSLVISVDFFDRLGWGPRDEAHRIRRTKNIAWTVGLLTVASSMLVGYIPGDLLTINYKTSNLLVVPLFIPFFMAFFVPWSTTFGTWVGTLASIISAVGIAFYEVFNLSIAWIMPVSLVVGIVVGCIASIVSIGPRPD